MIRIFRHLRKTLMEQSNVRNYFLYAVGEIFLVVFGIVIAIQVSNWNETRIIEESAKSHLKLLSQDLDEDRQLLEDILQIYVTNGESAERLLNIHKGIEPISEKITGDLVNLQLEYNFNQRKNALEVLINSGEIGALDANIQTLISRYYLSVDAISERDLITNSYIQNKYEVHIFNEYSYLYGKGNPQVALMEVYDDDKRAPISFDEEQFLSDKKLEALLFARLYQTNKQIELYEFSLTRLEELQQVIGD